MGYAAGCKGELRVQGVRRRPRPPAPRGMALDGEGGRVAMARDGVAACDGGGGVGDSAKGGDHSNREDADPIGFGIFASREARYADADR